MCKSDKTQQSGKDGGANPLDTLPDEINLLIIRNLSDRSRAAFEQTSRHNHNLVYQAVKTETARKFLHGKLVERSTFIRNSDIYNKLTTVRYSRIQGVPIEWEVLPEFKQMCHTLEKTLTSYCENGTYQLYTQTRQLLRQMDSYISSDNKKWNDFEDSMTYLSSDDRSSDSSDTSESGSFSSTDVGSD